MTRQAGFKRRVRARMAKTGESYATARGRLLAGYPGMTPDDSPLDWMPEALHISNGDATDVPGTGLARRVVYWRDVLHEGPVPEVAPAELRRIRVGYLTGYGSAGPAGAMRQFTERDQALEAGRDGEYVLWFEADLYDQLQITEVLARLADLGVPAGRITLICIGEHAGIARFGGLGELTAEQLRELPHTDACARLTPAALELATRAWAAFRAASPEGLGAIAAARLGELRFLGEAFDRLSREYPATRDGLSLTERRVLAAVADGAPDAGTAFVRAGARETRPYLGDSTCFSRMDRMAEGPHPLLRLDPPGRTVERTTGVRLTDTGRGCWPARPIRSPSMASTGGSAACTCRVATCRGAGTTVPKPSSTSPTRHRSQGWSPIRPGGFCVHVLVGAMAGGGWVGQLFGGVPIRPQLGSFRHRSLATTF